MSGLYKKAGIHERGGDPEFELLGKVLCRGVEVSQPRIRGAAG